MAHRYYIDSIEDGKARITGADAAHLYRVLRVKPEETLTLCDGFSIDYEAKVLSASADEILLQILHSSPSLGEPTLWAQMCIGYTKGEKMDWAIQKSIELGASVIQPFFSRYTVVKPKNEEEKNKRYNRIAQEAAKQCGRGIIPQVLMPLSFEQMLEQATSQSTAIFLYEKGGVPISHALESSQRISIISGAEGGFSDEEAEQARTAGCIITGLGPRILRAETAPLAALAVSMALTGNLE